MLQQQPANSLVAVVVAGSHAMPSLNYKPFNYCLGRKNSANPLVSNRNENEKETEMEKTPVALAGELSRAERHDNEYADVNYCSVATNT